MAPRDRFRRSLFSRDLEQSKMEVVDPVVKEEGVKMPAGEAKEGKPVTCLPTGATFEIKKWNAVTMWSWDISAETCAICRNSLNEPSIEYQVSP